MVEYVEVFGKKYPIRIGYYVMKVVKDKTGKSLQDAFKEAKENLQLHETILYAALKMGAYAENEELDLKEEDMPMILDLVFTDYMNAFSSPKFFPKKEDQPKIPEEQGELVGKQKKPTPRKT